jgi:hypothetical protein
MASVELRVLDVTGADAGILPSHMGGHLNTELSDTGGAELKYPARGINSDLLVDNAVVRVLIDGTEPKNARWVLEDCKPDDNPQSEQSRSNTWNGRTLVGMLEKVPVYPMNWPNPIPGGHSFTSASPGTIIQQLFFRARERNSRWAKKILTDTFSGSLDSAGKPWLQTTTQEFQAGANYLQILQLLFESGLIEFEMDGDQLLVYNPGTVYRDWTLFEWRSRWWNRSSTTYDSVDEATEPALTTTSTTIDYTNKDVNGTQNYNHSIHEANIETEGASYTLALLFKDAVRVIINGFVVYEKWTSGAETSHEIAMPLPLGTHSVRIEHFNTTGGERLRVQIRGGEFGVTNVALPSSDRTITVRRGQNLTDINRQVTSRERYDVALIAGDEGTFATTPAPVGDVDETFIQRGGVTDTGTLQAIGELQLRSLKQIRQQISATVPVSSELRPLLDFRAGDHIFVDDSDRVERVRALQINLQFDDASGIKASMTLNDKFQDLDVLIKKRLDWIAGGLEGVGPNPEPNPNPTDNTPPNPPENPTLDSLAYQSSDGSALAQVTLSWVAPTENANGTPLTDLAFYEIEYALFGETDYLGWESGGAPGEDVTSFSFSALPCSRDIKVRIRAVDQTNNRSEWSDEVEGETAQDTVPPNKPSDLAVFAGISTVSIEWDGLDDNGDPQPADFYSAEFHGSTSTAFTPTEATRIGAMPGAGRFIYSPPDDSRYDPRVYKMIAIDRSGFRSVPSDEAGPIAPQKVIGDDILEEAITESKIASAAITAAKTAIAAIDPASGDLTANSVTTFQISAGAVTALKLAAGSVSTDKLTVDAMSENLIPNGSFENPPAAGDTEPPGPWSLETLKGTSAQQVFLFTTTDYTQGLISPAPWRSLLGPSSNGFGVNNPADKFAWPALPGQPVFANTDYNSFEKDQTWLDANLFKNRITATSITDTSVSGQKLVEIVTLASGSGTWDIYFSPTGTTYNATVVPGATYTVEAWVWNASAVNAFAVDLRYKSSTSGASVSVGTLNVPAGVAWTFFSLDIVIPASPADTTGFFLLRFDTSGRTVRLDGLRIVRKEVGGYTSPNQPYAGSRVWRTVWSAASAAGGPVIRVRQSNNNITATGTWPADYIGVPHTMSAFLRAPSGAPTGYQMTLKARWYNASDVELTSTTGDTVTVSGSWQRSTVTSSPPPSAAFMQLSWERTAATSAVYDTLDLDGTNITIGDELYDYSQPTATLTKTEAKTADATLESSNVTTGGGELSGKLSIPDEHIVRLTSPPGMVAEDDLFLTEAWLREPSPTTSTQMSPVVLYAETAEDLAGPWTRFQVVTGNTVQVKFGRIEGGRTIPLGHKYGRLVVEVGPESYPHAARTVYVDDVRLSRAGGTAFIRDASIVDAKIANVSASKITVGTLFADIILGASIKTANTGQRVEINQLGVSGFNSTNALTTRLASADGTLLAQQMMTAQTAPRMLVGNLWSQLGTKPTGYPPDSVNTGMYFDSIVPMRTNFTEDYRPELRISYVPPNANVLYDQRALPSPYHSIWLQMSTGALDDASDAVGAYSYIRMSNWPTIDIVARNMNLSGNWNSKRNAYLFMSSQSAHASQLAWTQLGSINGTGLAQTNIYMRHTNTLLPTPAANTLSLQSSNSIEMYSGSSPGRIWSLLGARFSSTGANANATALSWTDGDLLTFGWDGSARICKGPSTTFVKTFVIDHPTPSKTDTHHLVHATTESPFNGVEYWGKAHLRAGRAIVALPPYFEDLCATNGRAVVLTPLTNCDHDDCPLATAPALAATYPADGQFMVSAQAGFVHDCASFFWLVKAIRKDVPNLQAEPAKAAVSILGDGPYKYVVQEPGS